MWDILHFNMTSTSPHMWHSMLLHPADHIWDILLSWCHDGHDSYMGHRQYQITKTTSPYMGAFSGMMWRQQHVHIWELYIMTSLQQRVHILGHCLLWRDDNDMFVYGNCMLWHYYYNIPYMGSVCYDVITTTCPYMGIVCYDIITTMSPYTGTLYIMTWWQHHVHIWGHCLLWHHYNNVSIPGIFSIMTWWQWHFHIWELYVMMLLQQRVYIWDIICCDVMTLTTTCPYMGIVCYDLITTMCPYMGDSMPWYHEEHAHTYGTFYIVTSRWRHCPYT